MVEIVGVGVSQFHNEDNLFELLIAYSDGREIGYVISRKVGEKITEAFTDVFGVPYNHIEIDAS